MRPKNLEEGCALCGSSSRGSRSGQYTIPMMAGSDDGRIGFDQVQGGLHVWCGRQSVFDQLPQVVLTDPDRLQKRLG